MERHGGSEMGDVKSARRGGRAAKSQRGNGPTLCWDLGVLRTLGIAPESPPNRRIRLQIAPESPNRPK